jgi:hypothetical protein
VTLILTWRLKNCPEYGAHGPTVMDHDEHITLTLLRFAGRSDRIPQLTDQFRKLCRRRLVIVGGPGSGNNHRGGAAAAPVTGRLASPGGRS